MSCDNQQNVDNPIIEVKLEDGWNVVKNTDSPNILGELVVKKESDDSIKCDRPIENKSSSGQDLHASYGTVSPTDECKGGIKPDEEIKQSGSGGHDDQGGSASHDGDHPTGPDVDSHMTDSDDGMKDEDADDVYGSDTDVDEDAAPYDGYDPNAQPQVRFT